LLRHRPEARRRRPERPELFRERNDLTPLRACRCSQVVGGLGDVVTDLCPRRGRRSCSLILRCRVCLWLRLPFNSAVCVSLALKKVRSPRHPRIITRVSCTCAPCMNYLPHVVNLSSAPHSYKTQTRLAAPTGDFDVVTCNGAAARSGPVLCVSDSLSFSGTSRVWTPAAETWGTVGAFDATAVQKETIYGRIFRRF